MSLNTIDKNYLLFIKIISFILITFITFLFGILPIYFSRFKNNRKFLSLANSFSGGLFIGIGLFHLLPEANENFETYFSSTGKNSIFINKPISYFIAFLSYSIILLIEKVVFDSHSLSEHINLTQQQQKEEKHPKIGLHNDEEDNAPLLHIKEENKILKMNEEEHYDSQIKINDANVNHFSSTSLMTPYILLVALSIHGLFEGTALGVMSKLRTTLYLLIVILAHKWAESFALGMNFVKSGMDMSKYFKMILIFAIFTPIGILMGICFSKANAFVQGSLLSVSGGTFLYISASEVIVEEFGINLDKYKKYFAYLLGGILVGIFAWFEVKEE